MAATYPDNADDLWIYHEVRFQVRSKRRNFNRFLTAHPKRTRDFAWMFVVLSDQPTDVYKAMCTPPFAIAFAIDTRISG